jgi:hypothetical protein
MTGENATHKSDVVIVIIVQSKIASTNSAASLLVVSMRISC